MYQKYGPLVKETVGGKTILHVFDLGKSILSSSQNCSYFDTISVADPDLQDPYVFGIQ
jgi:hypothetical protein